jgi:hypothetical protein
MPYPRPSGPQRDAVISKAAAAPAHATRKSATAGLRGQLRIMAVAAGATPDWTTLAVAGPTEMAGTEDRMRFEWTASVAVQRVTAFDALPDPDAFPPASPAEDCTMALRVDCSAHRPPRR